MDKRIIFSVAGSGKTTYIINNLNLEKYFLIVTYTENNYNNLRIKIINKFGFIPPNIKLCTYFNFLYSFCYKPFLYFNINSKGINWDYPPGYTLRLSRTNINYYMDKNKRLYHNRLAKLLEIQDIFPHINERLEKYYDTLFVDEVQDFAGHDFNLLLSITQANIDIILVGDYYQHTFDTSKDGGVNKNLYFDFVKYVKNFACRRIIIDTTTLSDSYRCSPTTCDFITNNLGISISSHRTDSTFVMLLEDDSLISDVYNSSNTVKLFYQNHDKYPCFSQNWGASKGQDHYNDVCVVLNKSTYRLFKTNKLNEMNEQTKNKFYVACTRARGNLYFISEDSISSHKNG